MSIDGRRIEPVRLGIAVRIFQRFLSVHATIAFLYRRDKNSAPVAYDYCLEKCYRFYDFRIIETIDASRRELIEGVEYVEKGLFENSG